MENTFEKWLDTVRNYLIKVLKCNSNIKLDPASWKLLYEEELTPIEAVRISEFHN